MVGSLEKRQSDCVYSELVILRKSISRIQITYTLPTQMGAKIMPKLTQKMVDIRERPKTGQVIVRDEELTGFAVRFTPKSAAYVVECRFNGANRRLTIGKTDRMSLEEARAKAREHLNKMASGIDPDAEKKIQKQATITLREVLDVYLATKQLKPSTINCYIDANVPMLFRLGWINQ